MTKLRTPVPAKVVAEILFACDSTCCICGERGKAVQIHHLDEVPSNHRIGNLSVLCLECHDQTQTRGGFGRKLTEEVVTKYRDEWIARVRERRHEADRLVVERAVGPLTSTLEKTYQESESADIVPKGDALEYINTLPALKAELLGRAQPEWDSGVTARMVQASYDYIDALSGILSTLAGYYPDGHFWDKDPHQFFAEQIATRFEWHRSHAEPSGPGTGGTIVNVICCGSVQADVEKMVEDMVMSIIGYDDEFDWKGWPIRWKGKTTL